MTRLSRPRQDSVDFSAGRESDLAAEIVRKAWVGLGDGRRMEALWDASPGVSTNRVFRVLLEDGQSVFAKIVSYGSFCSMQYENI